MTNGSFLRKLILALAVLAIILSSTFIFHYTQSFYKEFFQGKRYFDKSQYAKALPYFYSAFQIDPRDDGAARYLLLTYEKLKMRERLKETLELVAHGNPKNLDLLNQLADEYYKLGDYAKAEGLYRDILSKKKDLEVEREFTEVLIWQKKYSEAIPLLEKSLSRDPYNFKQLELFADVNAWAKNYDRAAELYKRLLPLGYRSKEVALKLADTLRYAGKNKEAVEIYRQYFGG